MSDSNWTDEERRRGEQLMRQAADAQERRNRAAEAASYGNTAYDAEGNVLSNPDQLYDDMMNSSSGASAGGGTGMPAPSITQALLSAGKKSLKEDAPKDEAREYSGYFQSDIIGPNPSYNLKESENIIRGKHNAIIILGRDRPGSESSGKGATANTNVGCIDIIAGLSGILAREVDTEGDKVLTNKSTELDSARIYISQRADIDSPEYFGLVPGKVGNLTNRSAIAVKADSVRIIGREGIKLVTSTDSYNGAAGMFIGDNIQGIDIIAGNNDADLQPMVKGDDLAILLDNMLELIVDLHGSAAFAVELIATLAAVFVDPTGAAVSKLSSMMTRLPIEVINLSMQELNFAFHEMNYSSKNPFAKYNFRSKYNNVN
jgi:cellobiose-specific phosphotransferase system component IIB